MSRLQEIIIIVLSVLLSLKLIRPLKSILNTMFPGNEVNNSLLSGLAVRGVLVIVLFYLISKRYRLSQFNGLYLKKQFYDILYIIPLTGLIILTIHWRYSIYSDVTLLLFGLNAFFIGLIEEITIRGIALPIFIKSSKGSKNALIFGVIISSFIFGFAHYTNLISDPTNFEGITFQVLFATSIGIVFGGLMLFSNNVILLSFIHGTINFIGGESRMKVKIQETVESNGGQDDIAITLIVFMVIALIGLLLSYFANQQKAITLINQSNI